MNAVTTLEEIKKEQLADPTIREVVCCLKVGEAVASESFKRIRSQLVVEDGVLMRSVKVPVDGVQLVSIIPASLQARLLHRAHEINGHASWECMWHLWRSHVFFPGMAECCQGIVKACGTCAAANTRHGEMAQPSRPETPSGPWDVVSVDTLHLDDGR